MATIRNGMVSATIEAGQPWYGGIISYYRKDRQILHTKFEGEYTGRNVHTEGDHYQIKVIFDANEGEHFYGLGQEQENQFDRKGSTCNCLLYTSIAFISIMLAMAIGMPSTLQYYKDNTKDMMFAFIFVGYLVVMLFDFRRIRKIPLDEALKRVE